MRRLWLYVARQYAQLLLFCWLALVILVVGTTLVDNAGGVLRQPQSSWLALQLAGWAAVEAAYQNWPLAAFLACLSFGNRLAQHGELLALQTFGLRPRWLALPLLAVTGLGVGLCGAAGEWLLPRSFNAKQHILAQWRRPANTTHFFTRRTPWFLEGEQLLFLPDVDAETAIFYQPTLYQLQDGVLQTVTYAERLVHATAPASGWLLYAAEQHSMTQAAVQYHAVLPLQLRVTTSDLIDVTGDPRQLPQAALRRLITRRAHAGFSTTAHRLALANRASQPLSALCLVLLALPWALHLTARPRRLASTLGLGVIVIAVYSAAAQVLHLLATKQSISVAVAAWGMPLCCLALSLGSQLRHMHKQTI